MANELEQAISTIAASAQRITDAMMAKGLEQPSVEYTIDMDGIDTISMHYRVGGNKKTHYIWRSDIEEGDIGPEEMAIAWIDAQDDAATRARAEFLRLAAAAADFAAKTPEIGADPELESIRAGITATMRKLSENAIAGPSDAPF